MTEATRVQGLLTDNQRMALLLELGKLEEAERKTAVSIWAVAPYAVVLGGVGAVDYAITFTALSAVAVPETPVILTAIKSLLPMGAIAAYWFLDQKITEATPSTSMVRRGAAVAAPVIPFGIGAYLGWEIFLSAREILTDATLGGGFLIEDPTSGLIQTLGYLFGGALAVTVGGFFLVSSFVGHRCLTGILEIARLYGATTGRAQEGRRLVSQIMKNDRAWGEIDQGQKAQLRDGQPVRDAVMAVSEAGFNGIRRLEKIITAKMLTDPPKRERLVVHDARLPDDMVEWSLKGLKDRVTEVKAAFLPVSLLRVYRLFKDLEETNDA